ncbi:phospholipase D-like domain-containing protein [Streptomyces sp. SL13]|uniref:Phospholipase D-like domain-containing protein n=1 Tax=Streptantibioticus silvisoli TaxID=2705255 RepID=A0AA90KFC1_9ACTN|nr:phospholipase D-like domain-containing protein [Streptantibioticus silvisoli]MDI5964444.1 phospholipase D-like domain-containing protein [Streptantibioticus silvisoli]MDI5969090.1 phospholipase D-like domain-containing protein [Streptantibioticus silvisoli]
MLRTTLRRAGIAVAAGSAVIALTAPAHAAGDYSAFAFGLTTTEPTIYDFINSATTSLDMTMYELQDTTAVNDLIAREQAGVTVRVILDRQETSTNSSAYSTLKAAGVGVTYSSTAFTYTHQKTITVDGDKSLVLTGNLTSKYYSTSRDYGVFDTDAADVSAIEAVFNADYADTQITPSDGDNLLWSPTDSTARLLTVINGATKTLDIEEEEFNDSTVVSAIADAAQRGVKVRLVLESPSDYSSEVTKIENAGATVVGYSSSTGFYMHAKVVVADYGQSDMKVEIGSMNDTTNSLTANRELGIILTDTSVAGVVETAFSSDYSGGTAA